MTKFYRPLKRHYKAGVFIFKEGEARDGVYIVETGQVEIIKQPENSGQLSLAKVGPKGVFGEMALIDNSPRSASAKAVEDTFCTVITPDMFEDQLKKLPPSLHAGHIQDINPKVTRNQ